MALSDEIQLQIYIIIGVCSFLFAALILAVSLIIYYLIKLYKEKNEQNSYLRKYGSDRSNGYKNNNAYNNNALEYDDELNRRYTMHRSVDEGIPPPPPSATLQSFTSSKSKKSKNDNEINNVVKTKSNVIEDVSEEFSWRKNIDSGSRFNTSIVMHHTEETFNSKHEGRTAFND